MRSTTWQKLFKATISNGGDQTGKEIGIYNYYNFPWDYILRYMENENENQLPVDKNEFMYYSLGKDEKTYMPLLKMNDYGSAADI